ncbi:MAG: 2-hydroxyacyl-CoA dehydratase [Desulfarculus sp.]|nr:2-hydroxyacyl-CoA dehydratase [Desulfarculus sp.]
MDRQEYLRSQKEDKGRKVCGVFPAQYPKEILWALNLAPAEIWDPPVSPELAAGHLQPYICSVVRQGLELLLQGKAGVCDAFLFPHTCDSIQNLASVVNDYIGLDKPCHFFYHPKAPHGAAAKVYYQEQLKALARGLEPLAGPLREDELKRRVAQGQRVAELYGQLYGQRAAGRLACSNAGFYQAARRGEYLFPDDLVPYLEGFLQGAQGTAPAGPRVLLSGVLPNPPEILTLLDDLGATVAADDLLACSRRLLIPPSAANDPWQALTEQYFAMPPCSSKGSPFSERLDFILGQCHKSGATGVIFYLVKFCEPELFDVPILTEELKKRGLPCLTLDVELNQGLSGQMSTRVEAFLEMINS